MAGLPQSSKQSFGACSPQSGKQSESARSPQSGKQSEAARSPPQSGKLSEAARSPPQSDKHSEVARSPPQQSDKEAAEVSINPLVPAEHARSKQDRPDAVQRPLFAAAGDLVSSPQGSVDMLGGAPSDDEEDDDADDGAGDADDADDSEDHELQDLEDLEDPNELESEGDNSSAINSLDELEEAPARAAAAAAPVAVFAATSASPAAASPVASAAVTSPAAHFALGSASPCTGDMTPLDSPDGFGAVSLDGSLGDEELDGEISLGSSSAGSALRSSKAAAFSLKGESSPISVAAALTSPNKDLALGLKGPAKEQLKAGTGSGAGAGSNGKSPLKEPAPGRHGKGKTEGHSVTSPVVKALDLDDDALGLLSVTVTTSTLDNAQRPDAVQRPIMVSGEHVFPARGKLLPTFGGVPDATDLEDTPESGYDDDGDGDCDESFFGNSPGNGHKSAVVDKRMPGGVGGGGGGGGGGGVSSSSRSNKNNSNSSAKHNKEAPLKRRIPAGLSPQSWAIAQQELGHTQAHEAELQSKGTKSKASPPPPEKKAGGAKAASSGINGSSKNKNNNSDNNRAFHQPAMEIAQGEEQWAAPAPFPGRKVLGKSKLESGTQHSKSMPKLTASPHSVLPSPPHPDSAASGSIHVVLANSIGDRPDAVQRPIIAKPGVFPAKSAIDTRAVLFGGVPELDSASSQRRPPLGDAPKKKKKKKSKAKAKGRAAEEGPAQAHANANVQRREDVHSDDSDSPFSPWQTPPPSSLRKHKKAPKMHMPGLPRVATLGAQRKLEPLPDKPHKHKLPQLQPHDEEELRRRRKPAESNHEKLTKILPRRAARLAPLKAPPRVWRG